MSNIESILNEFRTYHPSKVFCSKAEVQDQALFQTAENDRLSFWDTEAKSLIWFKPWTKTLTWNKPHAKWFEGGQLNASYNCLDTHLATHRKNKTAVLWEGENGLIRTYTYQELHLEVSKMANILKHVFTLKKGDRATLYLPMIPELMIAVLACARIGVIHSVVFGGFSAKSLRDRIDDSQSRVLITADGGSRRGQIISLKSIADEALQSETSSVEAVLVIRHLNNDINWNNQRDHDYTTLLKTAHSECASEPMESEDPLFILYTSGTTGKPKGIVHTTGGYLTHAKYSTRIVFDLKEDDIYFCTADIGWTGPICCMARKARDLQGH